MKLTKKQLKLIGEIAKTPQGNDFEPVRVTSLLAVHANLWKGGMWVGSYGRKDTLYLYPRKGKEALLKLIGTGMRADEIEYRDLLDYGTRNKDGYYPIIATGGLRIWWD